MRTPIAQLPGAGSPGRALCNSSWGPEPGSNPSLSQDLSLKVSLGLRHSTGLSHSHGHSHSQSQNHTEHAPPSQAEQHTGSHLKDHLLVSQNQQQGFLAITCAQY